MGIGQEYLEDWVGYLAFTSQRMIEGWYGLTKRARAGETRPSNVLADIIDVWSDIAAATFAVWQGPDKRPAVVLFRIHPEDDCGGSKCVPVYWTRFPNKPPDVLWLGVLGEEPEGDDLTFDENDLHVEVAGGALEIKVTTPKEEIAPGQVHDRKGAKLAEATYRAIVHCDEVPIADVYIVVRAIPTLAAEARRTRNKAKKGEPRRDGGGSGNPQPTSS
jgi:hypothetical protein